jgi:hypothetical protein
VMMMYGCCALPGEAANCCGWSGWILLDDARSQGRLHTAEAGVAGSCGAQALFQGRPHTAEAGVAGSCEVRARGGCTLLRQEWLDPVKVVDSKLARSSRSAGVVAYCLSRSVWILTGLYAADMVTHRLVKSDWFLWRMATAGEVAHC